MPSVTIKVLGGFPTNRKKTYDVEAKCATVWSISKGRIGFLEAEQALLYWIDQESQKEFSKLSLREGTLVWLYVVKELGKIISVVTFNGEKKEDLPKVEPVEVTL